MLMMTYWRHYRFVLKSFTRDAHTRLEKMSQKSCVMLL